MLIKKTLPLLIIAGFIASCQTSVESDMVSMQIKDDYDMANASLAGARTPMKGASKDSVTSTEDIWLGDTSYVREHKEPLPKKFETPFGITIASDKMVSFKDISNKINQLTGIPVRLDDMIEAADLEDMNLSYTGPLSGLLDQIALTHDMYWDYSNGAINYMQEESKTFRIYSLPVSTSFSARSGDIESTGQLTEWDEIEKAVTDMVQNGTVSVSPSIGTITVTAKPSTLRRVGDYVRNTNQLLSKQVAISINVLQVSLNDTDAFGINLTGVFNAAGMDLNITGINSSELATSGMNFAIGSDAKAPLSYFSGSEAALNAISQQGKVSILTSSVITTTNNKVAPVRNTTTLNYVDKVQVTITDSGTQRDPSSAAIEDIGFNIQLLPRIIDNSKLRLMFHMTLKDVLAMNKETTDTSGGYITLPEVEERTFMQEIVMESGQTLVLTGFEKTSNNDTKKGIGTPEITMLGGSRSATSERSVLVVIITPQILLSPLDPEARTSNIWGGPSSN